MGLAAAGGSEWSVGLDEGVRQFYRGQGQSSGSPTWKKPGKAMDSLGMLGYGIACFAVAIVLTLLVALFRPIKKHDDLLSWKVLSFCYVFTLFAPYGYIEVMTQWKGAPLSAAIHEVCDGVTKEGRFQYFKVLTCDETKARVIAVNKEKSFWGGDERSVMAINLVKTNGKWEATEFNWVYSDQRNKDSVTLPPYW